MHLEPEMTYTETIAGPWGPTTGSPLGARLCWPAWQHGARSGERNAATPFTKPATST